MKQTIKLSGRLKKVASFLPKGACFADIGSDHAYLSCYVCLQDDTARAIAGELNEGPYQSARRTVASYELDRVVEVRLGDGLEVIKQNEVSEIVIAGMGGSLITDILEKDAAKLEGVERIIAQPNIDARCVRKWLLTNGFTLTNEKIMEENGHIYEILVADKGGAETPYNPELKEKQLLFGPFLMKEKNISFVKKWKDERKKLQHVIGQMKQAKVQNEGRISQFEKELLLIMEVLKDEATSDE